MGRRPFIALFGLGDACHLGREAGDEPSLLARADEVIE
jgi:hypothetical protein